MGRAAAQFQDQQGGVRRSSPATKIYAHGQDAELVIHGDPRRTLDVPPRNVSVLGKRYAEPGFGI